MSGLSSEYLEVRSGSSKCFPPILLEKVCLLSSFSIYFPAFDELSGEGLSRHILIKPKTVSLPRTIITSLSLPLGHQRALRRRTSSTKTKNPQDSVGTTQPPHLAVDIWTNISPFLSLGGGSGEPR